MVFQNNPSGESRSCWPVSHVGWLAGCEEGWFPDSQLRPLCGTGTGLVEKPELRSWYLLHTVSLRPPLTSSPISQEDRDSRAPPTDHGGQTPQRQLMSSRS